MRKSTHSPEYQQVLALLVAMRQKAGMTQRDLAKRLGREHSFVWRIETGERRLDVLEFYWVCQTLGENAPSRFSELIHSIETQNESRTPAPFIIKAAEPKAVYRIRPGKRP